MSHAIQFLLMYLVYISVYILRPLVISHCLSHLPCPFPSVSLFFFLSPIFPSQTLNFFSFAKFPLLFSAFHIPQQWKSKVSIGNVSKTLLTHCKPRQSTATHCYTLKHTATHCNTLQSTATHCNTLQHTAAYMYRTSTLQVPFQSQILFTYPV